MKTAIITGATHGIGFAIATRLAKEGFTLCICSRNEEELNRTQADLKALGAPEVYIKAADLGDKETAITFARFAVDSMGAIDILVNNAGMFLPGDLCDEPDGQLEQMMQLNVYSAYEITRLVVPAMKQRKSGHIFNMCSVASLKAYPQGGSYSISKYALLGFSDNLREELKLHCIKVTAICPGATYSRSWQSSGVAEERMIPASDIAEIVWTSYNLSAGTNLETIVVRPQFGDL
jgi:short-subunit dehydrogenase